VEKVLTAAVGANDLSASPIHFCDIYQHANTLLGELAGSVLFDHTKGALIGANAYKPGVFEKSET